MGKNACGAAKRKSRFGKYRCHIPSSSFRHAKTGVGCRRSPHRGPFGAGSGDPGSPACQYRRRGRCQSGPLASWALWLPFVQTSGRQSCLPARAKVEYVSCCCLFCLKMRFQKCVFAKETTLAGFTLISNCILFGFASQISHQIHGSTSRSSPMLREPFIKNWVWWKCCAANHAFNCSVLLKNTAPVAM